MDEKDKKIQKLEAIILAQAVLIKKLEARIDELERMLGLNSSKSSAKRHGAWGATKNLHTKK